MATVVVPALYGDTPVEARPFLSTPADVLRLPALTPGDTVIAFYDGGDPMTILRWYLTSGEGAVVKEYADVIRWNSAWGVVAVIPPWQIQGFTFIGPTGQWGISDFSLTAGRRYRITTPVRAFSGGSFTVRPGSGNTFPIVADTYFPAAAAGFNNIYYAWIVEPSTTDLYDLVLDIYPSAGTPSVYAEAATIEDVGPVMPTAVAPPAGQPSVVAAGNALGIVAMGAMVLGAPLIAPSSTATAVTHPLAFTSQVGRRYRIVTKIRAISPTSTNVLSGVYLRTSGSGLVTNNDTWITAQYQHESLEHAVIFDGTGVAGTYQTTITTQAATGQNVYTDQPSCFFYIEDVGPNTYPALPLPAVLPSFTPVPTLLTNWRRFNNDPLYTIQYRKVGDKVELRGLAQRINIDVTAPEYIFFLPAGFYCPTRRPLFYAQRQDGLNGRIIIDQTNGGVVMTVAPPAYPNMAVNGWISLDNVEFSTTG